MIPLAVAEIAEIIWGKGALDDDLHGPGTVPDRIKIAWRVFEHYRAMNERA